jgi:hypothetical protein
MRPQPPPGPEPIGEVVLVLYGSTPDQVSVSVSASERALSLEEAEALALDVLQRRASGRAPFDH